MRYFETSYALNFTSRFRRQNIDVKRIKPTLQIPVMRNVNYIDGRGMERTFRICKYNVTFFIYCDEARHRLGDVKILSLILNIGCQNIDVKRITIIHQLPVIFYWEILVIKVPEKNFLCIKFEANNLISC